MFSERLLQYIWQFQYYNRQTLQTTVGEALEIIHPGEMNRNQGPDFRQARIKINNVLWAGDVELHIKASAWLQHRHQTDGQYNKVVLHVVYENDKPIQDAYGNPLPTLELSQRIPTLLLQRYADWMLVPKTIPCQAEINTVSSIIWKSWQQRLLIERLQQKTERINDLLAQSSNNWEQVFWQLTCRYFGGPVNAESFEQIAASLPVTLLAKCKSQLHQLEALLLGQAGFLQETFMEHYPLLLQKEYRFLRAKYKLQLVTKAPLFLRMRPPNFPTIRLAQLAMLVHQSAHLFSKVKEAATVTDLTNLFTVSADAFWNTHFRLTEVAAQQPKKTGKQLIDTVLINVAAPVLFAYGRYVAEESYCDKALALLEEIAAEKNSVMTAFTQLSIENKNAFQSQALLQLKKHYCDDKRCLECAVGNAILKRS